MSLHCDLELKPLDDPMIPTTGSSRWAFVTNEKADVAVIVEEIAVGDTIPLHRHQVDEVIAFQASEGEVRIDGETHEVRAGDLVIIPAGAAHGTKTSAAKRSGSAPSSLRTGSTSSTSGGIPLRAPRETTHSRVWSSTLERAGSSRLDAADDRRAG